MDIHQLLQKPWKGVVLLSFVAVIFIVLNFLPAYAQEDTAMKTLIVYYSRTGNTKAVCEALQKELRADIIEIHDLKNRAGGWGFFTGAIGSLFSTHTRIEPATPDLTAYSNILIGSPVWSGKMSTAIRTFIAKNRFDGKKVVILTTTNALEKEGSQNKSKALVQQAGGVVAGYYQVLAREKADGKRVERTQQQIADDGLKLAPEIKKALSGAF
jgi:flavodoxin